jgi:hypothetical protein
MEYSTVSDMTRRLCCLLFRNVVFCIQVYLIKFTGTIEIGITCLISNFVCQFAQKDNADPYSIYAKEQQSYQSYLCRETNFFIDYEVDC